MKKEKIQFKIQLATASDLEQIASIIRETAKWLKTKGISQWNDSYPVARLEVEVAQGELFVVRDRSQKILGTLSLSKEKDELWPEDSSSVIYLHRVAISREFAGHNLGTALIDWVKEYCRQNETKVIRLNCDKTNPFLPDFYRKCGFNCVGESFYPPWKMTFLNFEMKIE